MRWNRILIVVGIVALCVLIPYSEGWIFESKEEKSRASPIYPPYWVTTTDSWKEAIRNPVILEVKHIANLSVNNTAKVELKIETNYVDCINTTLFIKHHDLPINVYIKEWGSGYKKYLCRNNSFYNYTIGKFLYRTTFIYQLLVQKTGEINGNKNITICIRYTPIDKTIPLEDATKYIDNFYTIETTKLEIFGGLEL